MTRGCLRKEKDRDRLIEFESAIRAESADQARKEAVDSETLSDIRRICEIIVG